MNTATLELLKFWTRQLVKKEIKKMSKETEDLKTKVNTLGDVMAEGFAAIRADLQRLAKKVPDGDTVVAADIQEAGAKLDAFKTAVEALKSDVDTTADGAAGQDDPDPTGPGPFPPEQV